MDLIVDVIVLMATWFYWFYLIPCQWYKKMADLFFFFFLQNPPLYFSFPPSLHIMTLIVQNMTLDAINTTTPLSNTTTLDDTILFEKMNRECILFPTYAKRDPQGTTSTWLGCLGFEKYKAKAWFPPRSLAVDCKDQGLGIITQQLYCQTKDDDGYVEPDNPWHFFFFFPF